MGKQVEFYFDVGSPNCYLAQTQLGALAAAEGAEVVLIPMLLGGVFKATGNSSPATIPAKGAYSGQDMARWVARYGIPFERNPHFPVNTITLMRGAVAQQRAGALERYLEVIYDAMWVNPKKLDDPAVLAQVLKDGGYDVDEFIGQVGDQAIKDKLKENTEQAVARGVFGAPTFFVGEAMFFGQDRMEWIVEALQAG